LNEANNSHKTPLENATSKGHEVIVQYLIEKGANKEINRLLLFASKRLPSIVKLALDQGACIDTINDHFLRIYMANPR